MECKVLDLKRVRGLDAAIAAVAAVVVILGAYLAYSVWAGDRAVVSSTPAQRAIEAFAAKVRKNPNDINARMQLAQAYSVGGREAEAIKQYKEVLSVSEEYIPALSGIGFSLLKEKEFKTAEGYFRKIIELIEGKVSSGREATLESAYFYLGTALYEQRDYEEAAANFKEALRLKRDASDTHYALAKALEELDSPNAYKESLENALLFDPKMPEANYDYGLVMLEEGDEAAAAEHFRASAEAAPNATMPREALAKLGPFSPRFDSAKSLEKSDPRKALSEVRIAVALDPQSVPALVLKARLYEETGDKEEAAAAYRSVLALDPENKPANDGLKRVTDGS
jgi:tetratricopeptide (TPR) repeat protein